jgi:hypothetical protein
MNKIIEKMNVNKSNPYNKNSVSNCHLKYLIIAIIFFFPLPIQLISQIPDSNGPGNNQLECGECIIDNTSPKGGSQFCKFGNMGSWIPCDPGDEPSPSPCPSTSGVDLVLTTDTTPVCCAGKVISWNNIKNNQYGVSGHDIDGHYIRNITANRFETWIDGWRPFDVFKQTMCGELHSFSVYDGNFLESDKDWNNGISLDPAFHDLFYDARSWVGNTYGDQEWKGKWVSVGNSGIKVWIGGWDKCGNNVECINGEVTPDQGLSNNPWFPNNNEESPLVGTSSICLYGPFVMDASHHQKPEIHPSELIWWKTDFADKYDLYTLMQINDKSFRFHTGGKFEESPSGWKPWASAPKKSKFRIAFDLNPKNEKIEFQIIQPLDNKEVHTKDFNLGPKDDVSKNRHTVTHNGRVIVEAIELIDKDEDLDIGFFDICRNESDTRLQGYLQIISVVDDIEIINNVPMTKGGYQVVSVLKKKIGPPEYTGPGSNNFPNEFMNSKLKILTPPYVHFEPSPSVSGKYLSGTIQKGVINGQSQLFADIQVQFKNSKHIGKNAVEVKSVKLLGRNKDYQLTFIPDSLNNRGIVKCVPIIQNEKLEFTMASGSTMTQGVGGITISPMIGSVTPFGLKLAKSSWINMCLAAGGDLNRQTSISPRVQIVSEWEIEAIPFYAPLVDGQTWAEEVSPLTQEINGALQKGDKVSLEKIFGAIHSPLEVEWKVKIVNLTTNEIVSIDPKLNRPSKKNRLELLDGMVPNAKVKIRLPSNKGDNIYEIRATATMRDIYGNIGEAKYIGWSHVIPMRTKDEIEKLLKLVAELSGVDSHELLLASRIDGLQNSADDPVIEEAYFRRARMVRMFGERSANDEIVSVGELQGLISGARLFGKH